jgi:AbrB family looped-hinge helix DNA binding protein
MAQPAGELPDRAVIRRKGQLTLPQQVRRQLGLHEGDNLIVSIEDGRVVLTPATLIPRDQAWFWDEQWQAGEREVDRELAAGVPGRVYRSDEEFLAALQRGVDDPAAL